MSCKLTFNDGTTLDDLTLSGSCFVSKSQVTPEMFSGKLDRVRVSVNPGSDAADYEGIAGEHIAMELGGVFEADGAWYFWLREPDAQELARMKDRADIEYIAMMTGVEL